ncbi:hypothetical protein ACEPAG_6888 [Sanghuangporus baumii]
MAEQKALILDKPQGGFSVGTRPIPKPGPGAGLVKVHAAALNPVDWAVRDRTNFVSHYPAVVGVDFAGVDQNDSSFFAFDFFSVRVFQNSRRTFQERLWHVPAEITIKIPPNISFEEADTVSACMITAATGLYGWTCVLSGEATKYKAVWEEGGEGLYREKPTLLVGGSLSIGRYAIQTREAFSSIIIVTASLRNADLLKSIVATHVIDRKSPDISAEVRKILNSKALESLYDATS